MEVDWWEEAGTDWIGQGGCGLGSGQNWPSVAQHVAREQFQSLWQLLGERYKGQGKQE